MSDNNTTSFRAVDPAALISHGPMSWFQIAAVGVCVLINALDGFDVMVVAFTAAAVAREWSVAPQQLGALFSAGLVGMALGAVFVAPLGDRYGRRPLIVGCQVLIAVTMLMSAVSQTLWQLGLTRVLTGIGIGGLLASINIMVAEYASTRRRALCIGIMSLGYPLGAAAGGLLSIALMQAFDWRSVYVAGGLSMLVAVPLTLWLLPESVSFMLLRRKADTLASINRVLERMGKGRLQALPDAGASAVQKPSIWRLFQSIYAGRAVVMGLVYCSIMFSVYFVLNWIPKILTGMGFSDSGGISASLLMNVAGAAACVLMGVLATRLGLRLVSLATFVGMFASMVWFGVLPADSPVLLVSVAVMGFFLFSTIAASYAVVPEVFPAEIRLTAMGACLAFGRLGGVLGPYVAGVLMAEGWSRAAYCAALAAPMLLAALAILCLRQSGETQALGVALPQGSQ